MLAYLGRMLRASYAQGMTLRGAFPAIAMDEHHIWRDVADMIIHLDWAPKMLLGTDDHDHSRIYQRRIGRLTVDELMAAPAEDLHLACRWMSAHQESMCTRYGSDSWRAILHWYVRAVRGWIPHHDEPPAVSGRSLRLPVGALFVFCYRLAGVELARLKMRKREQRSIEKIAAFIDVLAGIGWPIAPYLNTRHILAVGIKPWRGRSAELHTIARAARIMVGWMGVPPMPSTFVQQPSEAASCLGRCGTRAERSEVGVLQPRLNERRPCISKPVDSFHDRLDHSCADGKHQEPRDTTTSHGTTAGIIH